MFISESKQMSDVMQELSCHFGQVDTLFSYCTAENELSSCSPPKTELEAEALITVIIDK